jgi:hypothetical protein
MADYLEEWTAKAGKDNFGEDPPNATLSVYEPGQADNSIVVVEITNPVVDGADLIYSYKIIEGKMPAAGGATSLFIDWIGPGGGVGVGFMGLVSVLAVPAFTNLAGSGVMSLREFFLKLELTDQFLL